MNVISIGSQVRHKSILIEYEMLINVQKIFRIKMQSYELNGKYIYQISVIDL